MFASFIAPFGGFFASGFKRGFKIKDFGDSIPGHGGVTDRFDCQVGAGGGRGRGVVCCRFCQQRSSHPSSASRLLHVPLRRTARRSHTTHPAPPLSPPRPAPTASPRRTSPLHRTAPCRRRRW